MRFVVDSPARSSLDGETARPSLLHEIFERTSAAYPDNVAVSCGGLGLTYSEVDRRANRLARLLRAGGVRKGDHVGLHLPRSAEVYVALLAILKAGAAYVPLDPDYPADRVGFILEDCQAHSLITTTSNATRHASFSGRVIALDAPECGLDDESATPLPAPECGLTPADVCYVIYTSGTTGRPKGVQIEHRNACHLVHAEQQIFDVGPDDRVYQGFSIAFDASVEEVWLAFSTGATLVVGTKEMAQAGPELARRLTSEMVSVFSTVPTLLALIEDDLPTVRILILGGEQCPQDLVTRWARPGRRMVNTYGPTEATVIATYADCVPGRPVTIGRAVPGYSVHLLDDRMRPVPEGAEGELYIGGPGVARGYVGLPALTAEKFVDDPFALAGETGARLYRSGDLGRWNSSGEIEFLGRIDSQVKLRGFRIELSEIESVLMGVPAVQACAVALREDVPGLPQLVAYVVPKGGVRVDTRTLRESLRGRLPAYMLPSRFETIDALPTLPSGKVDRRSLPTPRTSLIEDFAAPEPEFDTELERKLATAWNRLFSPLSVSPQDDFFLDLGGHSLLAARLVSELRADPELRELSVLDLYSHPTIERLAAKIERDRANRVEEAENGSIAPEPTGIARFRSCSNRAFALCGLAQFIGLYFVLGFFSLQWLGPYLTYTWLIEHDFTLVKAILGSLMMLLGLYPVMLGVSVAVKWVVLGRIKPGEYPLWGVQYFRWWFVNAIQSSVPVEYMAGTPLLNWYYRALGARIGSNVYLGSSGLSAFDLVSVGDDSCIGCETDFSGYTVEDGFMKVGRITIGRGCFVGNRSVIRENTVIEDGAKLEDLSFLPRGGRIPAGERWSGSPARRIARRASWKGVSEGNRPTPWRRAAFGALHGFGLLLFPVMVIAAIFPGIIVMNELGGRGQGYWYLCVTPLVALSFVILLCLEIAVVKKLLLGKVVAEKYDVHSGFYVRKWFVDQLMELSLDVLGPLYATIYLAPWYRLLGAKLGRRAEVSTASFISPDLLTVCDEGFIADAVSLGAARVEDGRVTLAEVHVGVRAFVGNSALLPPGAVVGDNGLIGCLSTPPATIPGASTAGTAWLGSPAVFLPQRQESTAFGSELTYNPTRKLQLQRAAIEFCRVILPSTCFLIFTSLLLSVSLEIRDDLSAISQFLLFPVLYGGFGVAAALTVVVFKWALMGRYRPADHPLWSTFVWKTELVTSMYENLARLFLVDELEGTPFLGVYLRMLGMKVGKRVFLNSAEFTEFDLVEIGDDVAINEGCTIQTHLFEDRVMKVSTVRVEAKCSVGAQSVVLYDTLMEEGSSLNSLSLLMKGEILPAWTRWEGSPARARTGLRGTPVSRARVSRR